jgi:osmotically-inducible protein OsmY
MAVGFLGGIMRLYAGARTRATLPTTLLVGLAAVIAALTAGCGRSDATVQSDVQQQLAADPATSSAHLTVTVKDGVAQIQGETDTMAQQQRALDVARAVKGVTQVESEMRLNDAALTQDVKKAIAADASVSDIPLRIEIKDGEVKLYSDKTNGDQRTRLKELASSVPGVVGVEDNMK